MARGRYNKVILPTQQTPLIASESAYNGVGSETASAAINKYLDRRIALETVTATYHSSTQESAIVVVLLQTPIVSITSVKLNDVITDYTYAEGSGNLAITAYQQVNTIEVIYEGGYDPIPPDVVEAIKITQRALDQLVSPNESSFQISADLQATYENPQRALPFSAKSLLSHYKRVTAW